MLYWNCPIHETHKQGCEDCEQITREMQPEYCMFGMGKKESPHQYDESGRCRCGYPARTGQGRKGVR